MNDNACKHRDLDFKLEHVHMDDCNVGAVKISATCKGCGAKMVLSRGLMAGASSMIATADGLEGDIMIPVIARGELPDKEWGFVLRLHEVPEGHDAPIVPPVGRGEAGAPAAQPTRKEV